MAIAKYQNIALVPFGVLWIVLHDIEVQRREDVCHAKRPGTVPAAGMFEHADYILTDRYRHLIQLLQCQTPTHITPILPQSL